MNNGAYALCFALIGIIARTIQHFRWGRCTDYRSLMGKTVVITGANSGIGKETAKELARRDARVILACRDISSAFQAVADIRNVTPKGELIVLFLNLASFKSIKLFVEAVSKIDSKVDILINNAGVYLCPLAHSVDGFEMQLAVNYLGHFLLTNLLLDKLERAEDSRVLIVTSSLYKKGKIDFDNLNSEKYYNKSEAYKNSKLALILFGLELKRILRRKVGNNISTHIISPGVVWTNLGRHVNWSWWMKALAFPFAFFLVRTANEGCQTIVHCAVAENLKSGGFYRNCKETKLEQVALDQDLAEKLWNHSRQLVKLDDVETLSTENTVKIGGT